MNLHHALFIFAGGSGTRLWPLSRERFPKQFIKLQGKETSLFQDAFNRSLMLAEPEGIYIVTNEKYKFLFMGATRVRLHKSQVTYLQALKSWYKLW